MAENTRAFPEWETLYKNRDVKSMPWYNEEMDADLELGIGNMNLNKNGIFLDLGTGPGTQAIKIAEKGFIVIASDLSPTAIKKASLLYNQYTDNNNIKFVVDDILDSKFKDNEFDYIFDRGCFHVISPVKRTQYIKEIRRILKDNGILFLKCFSEKEPMREFGPYGFSPYAIKELFETRGFKIQYIKDTVYQGTLNPLPQALFIVMIKIAETSN